MKLDLRMLFACVALGLAACQGGFSSGGTSAPLPPTNGSVGVNSVALGSAAPSGGPSVPPGDTVSYAFAQASQGLQCPQSQGFTCVLRFNVGTAASVATAAPSAKSAASPRATASGSSSPSASPTPGTAMTITIAALPNDAPALPNSNANAKPTVALVRLRLTVNDAVMLQGNANATFTLPQAQAVSGRAFAVALFHETVRRRHRDDKFFGSYAKSTLDGTSLRFSFTPPKIQVKKDETWLLVLYGDQCSSCNATPAPATAAPNANSGNSGNSGGFNSGGQSKPGSRPSP